MWLLPEALQHCAQSRACLCLTSCGSQNGQGACEGSAGVWGCGGGWGPGVDQLGSRSVWRVRGLLGIRCPGVAGPPAARLDIWGQLPSPGSGLSLPAPPHGSRGLVAASPFPLQTLAGETEVGPVRRDSPYSPGSQQVSPTAWEGVGWGWGCLCLSHCGQSASLLCVSGSLSGTDSLQPPAAPRPAHLVGRETRFVSARVCSALLQPGGEGEAAVFCASWKETGLLPPCPEGLPLPLAPSALGCGWHLDWPCGWLWSGKLLTDDWKGLGEGRVPGATGLAPSWMASACLGWGGGSGMAEWARSVASLLIAVPFRFQASLHCIPAHPESQSVSPRALGFWQAVCVCVWGGFGWGLA